MALEPKLVCTKGGTLEQVFDAPTELVAHIKKEVAQYLPGMDGAELRCSHTHRCRGKQPGHECPSQALGEQAPGTGDEQLVFTLQKTVRAESHEHARIVRVTTSRAGQLLKIAMSK